MQIPFKEIEATLKDVTFPVIPPSTLAANQANIKAAIGRSLPAEVAEFYRLCDGFEHRTQHPGWVFDEGINSLAMMFDNFKPLQKLDEDYTEECGYCSDPFYEQMWNDWLLDTLDLDDEESIQKFNKIRRQKQLVTLNGDPSSITIDFYEPEYKIYYMNDSCDMFQIRISFTQFVHAFAYLGSTGSWYALFMSQDDKINSFHRDVNWNDIEAKLVGFKREMILS